jgi:hypothetical protein
VLGRGTVGVVVVPVVPVVVGGGGGAVVVVPEVVPSCASAGDATRAVAASRPAAETAKSSANESPRLTAAV